MSRIAVYLKLKVISTGRHYDVVPIEISTGIKLNEMVTPSFAIWKKNGQTLLNGMFLCICRSVLVENSNIYFDSRSRRCGKPKTFTKVGIVPLLRPAIKSESHGSVGYDRINGVPCHGRNWHDKGPSMLRP